MANGLSQDETETLGLILDDLKLLFQKDVIPVDEIDEVVGQLKSDEVRAYLNHLKSGSKPEVALREAFFAGRSILSKYLAADISPEVNLGEGFIDYQIGSSGRFILLELKTLFEAEIVQGKSGRELKALKQRPLKWEDHKEQVLKYIRKGGEYIVLTNLKEWYFFNDECNPDRCEPFHTTDLFSFLKDFEVSPNLYERLERYDFESIREELDKRFFESLKAWVKKLSEVEFDVDEKRKLEIIIGLINRFVFIQTLDDYGVIHFRWIKNAWDHAVQRWSAKGKLQVLKEFFREVNEWFYEYYDTELFRNEVLEHIKVDDENVNLFYRNLELVLGLAYWQTPIGGFRGIIQYNFRFIDEDIFGKAYETFLAEVRKEQGIFYTPRYITEYIVENTVGRVFDELLQQIKRELEAENFESIPPLIERFKSIRILDPACGSGSFLIKATRKIFEKYRQLYELLDTFLNKYDQFNGTLFRPQNSEYKATRLMQIREAIVETSERELICKILVRHIHGNDLDAKALEVAKVNLWLEAIKLAPSEFRFDRLPSNTNHVLPTLEMNLCIGDSVVGLPEELAIRYLHENYQGDMIKLCDLRHKYLENPVDPKLVDEIDKIKNSIRNKLDEEFRKYLEAKRLPVDIFDGTKPFHWPLEFWFVFFDKTGSPLQTGESGFDVVIGNPPYVDYRLVKPLTLHKFFKAIYQSCIGNKEKYNLYIVFIEKGVKLLRADGLFSYINPIQVMSAYMALPLRKFLLTKYSVREIVDLSNVRVFEEAATYPILLFLQNKEPESDSKIKISYKTTEDEIVSRNIKFNEASQAYFAKREDKVILVDCRSEILELIKQMDENRKLYDIMELRWGTSRSGYGKKKIAKDRYDKLSENEKQKYVPLAQSGDIVRYIIDWQGEYIERSIYPEKQMEQFRKPKIIISRQSLSMESGYDADGFYALGKVAFTSFFREAIPPKFLLALLNSELLDFYFKKVYETLHMGGGYIRYDIPYLHQLPVIPWTESEKKKLAEQIQTLTDQITRLKQARSKFVDLWCEWSVRLKTSENSLRQLIINDAELTRRGEFDKAWFSKVSFYTNSENAIVNKEFKRFKVYCDPDKPLLKIYGQVNQHMEEFVYEMQFVSRQLMEHIYLSLLQAFTSKVKMKTFSDVLAKTIIPIVNDVNKWSSELTPNIVKKTKEEFERWIEEERINGIEADIVKIDNEIEDLEAKIDALVFKLYELDENELEVIFDSLKTSTTRRRNVIEYFRKL